MHVNLSPLDLILGGWEPKTAKDCHVTSENKGNTTEDRVIQKNLFLNAIPQSDQNLDFPIIGDTKFSFIFFLSWVFPLIIIGKCSK